MRLSAPICAGVLLAACSEARPLASVASPPASVAEDRQLIEQAFSSWLDAYERGDPDALANLFTEDGLYAANTGELLTGRSGIRAGVAAWMQGSSRVGQQRTHARLDLHGRSLRFGQDGAIAYELLRFTIKIHPPGCFIDAGHALAVWEKQLDGRWLIDVLTVNQDKTPVAGACARS